MILGSKCSCSRYSYRCNRTLIASYNASFFSCLLIYSCNEFIIIYERCACLYINKFLMEEYKS
uniref:Uncharacterized protein n=1 Tax=Arundo donax TaxID=35708 RepID=A0A0A9GQN0_ARUDO